MTDHKLAAAALTDLSEADAPIIEKTQKQEG